MSETGTDIVLYDPAFAERQRKLVKRGFWHKLRRFAGIVPFAEDAVSAWYTLRDPATPHRVRLILTAALAYFVMPADAVPDFIAAVGFTDDAAVVMAAIQAVSPYIKPRHRKKAREALLKPEPAPDPDDAEA